GAVSSSSSKYPRGSGGGKPPVRPRSSSAAAGRHVDSPRRPAHVRSPNRPKGLHMPVVVVESPAKAKTINKYLGDDYTVLASFGHVRDLPPKDGSVDTDADFAMKWEVAADSRKHLKAIKDALASDPTLILATDPDREGEAISWHLLETLA